MENLAGEEAKQRQLLHDQMMVNLELTARSVVAAMQSLAHANRAIAASEWLLQAEAKVERGYQLLCAGLIDEARGFLREAIAQDPGNLQGHLLLLLTYHPIKESAEADSLLRKVIRLLRIEPNRGRISLLLLVLDQLPSTGELRYEYATTLTGSLSDLQPAEMSLQLVEQLRIADFSSLALLVLEKRLRTKAEKAVLERYLDLSRELQVPLLPELPGVLVRSPDFDESVVVDLIQRSYRDVARETAKSACLQRPTFLLWAFLAELGDDAWEQDFRQYLAAVPYHPGRKTTLDALYAMAERTPVLVSVETVDMLRQAVWERYPQWEEDRRAHFRRAATDQAKKDVVGGVALVAISFFAACYLLLGTIATSSPVLVSLFVAVVAVIPVITSVRL